MRTIFTSALTLFLLLAAGAAAAEPRPAAERAKLIAPYIDERTVVVAYVDLSRLQIEAVIDKAVELVPELSQTQAVAKAAAGGLLSQLGQAGAKDAFIVVSIADVNFNAPYAPLVVVPLGAAADEAKLKTILAVVPLEVKQRVGNAFVACGPATFARLQKLKPDPRPELTAAFEAAGNSVGQILVLPPAYSRRVIDELLPKLPDAIGGGPSTALTRGLRWAAIGLDLAPQPALRMTIQSQDAQAAQAGLALWQQAFKVLGRIEEVRSAWPDFESAAKWLTPEVHGERLSLVLDERTQGLGQLMAMLKAGLLGARQQAQRTQSMNNLKQLGLAMHMYHDSQKTLPAAASYDAAGKPLLSWRVHLLPYLDQEKLYKQFHLDEPWDSAHNRQLIEQMPAVLRSPQSQRAARGLTTYVVAVGEGTAFPGRQAVALKDITDGTSNTILAIEVDDPHAVVWTKPEDLPFSPDKPRAGLSGSFESGLLALYCDGSVRVIPKSIEDQVLRLLFLRADGTPIPNF